MIRAQKVLQSIQVSERSNQQFLAGSATAENQNMLTNMMFRVFGASVGRKVADVSGARGAIQVPGIFTTAFGKIAASLGRDQTIAIIEEAVMNPNGKLMNDLLHTKKSLNPPEMVKRLRGHLFTIQDNFEAGEEDQ